MERWQNICFRNQYVELLQNVTRGNINIYLIQDSQKNIFLVKNVLKSYVLKSIWLFNKATWEKEANTQ